MNYFKSLLVCIATVVVGLLSNCENKKTTFHDKYIHAHLYYNDEIPWDICRLGCISPIDFIKISKHHIFLPSNDTLRFLETRLDSLYDLSVYDSQPLQQRESLIDTYFAIVFQGNNITDTLAIGATHYSRMAFRNVVFRDSVLYFTIVDIIKHYDKKWENQFDSLYYPCWLDDSTLIMYNIFNKAENPFINR